MSAASPVAQRAIRRVSTPISSRRPSEMSEEAAPLDGAIYRTIGEVGGARLPAAQRGGGGVLRRADDSVLRLRACAHRRTLPTSPYSCT